MVYSAKSYEKLFNSFLLNEYPEIERFEVTGNFPLSVKIHLKDYDYNKNGVVPSSKLRNVLFPKIISLTDYFGERIVPYITMYFNGERIAP